MPKTCVLFATGVLLAAAAAAVPRSVSAEPVNIGIIGDQAATSSLDTSYQILQQGVDALKAQSTPLDVVLHVGDMVESTQSETEIRARFSQVTGILDQLPVQWYETAGDHDVNPPQFQQDSPDRSRETLFKQLYSQINPKVADQLYYSFDVKGYHFVALYTEEQLDTDPRWGNVFYAQISDAQYDWLQEDLAANPNSAGIVVFLHQPHWYNWSGWSRVHELLRQYPVRVVIAGHFHYNQSEALLDGIQYWVVGATGGTTKQGNPNSGDVQQVTVLQIDGTSLTFTPISLAPVASMTWTPRHYMDRVQAQEQLLGNLYSFAADSPVFLDSGKLVKACGSSDPAQLVLAGIGNAIELPVTLSIDVTAPASIAVTQGAFASGMCQDSIGTFGCRLKPSAGVVVSNTSIVETAQGAPPLWTGTLGLAGSPPPVGTVIPVQVVFSFIANNQTYLVYTDVSTKVQGCSA
jgi:3',5'-cyclic AMP phosphodiesterase CpdA